MHLNKKHNNLTSLLHGPEDTDRRFVMVDDGRGRGEEDMLPCTLCEFVFNSHKELQEHKAEKHRGAKTDQCHTCGKTFRSKISLQQHKRRVHSGLTFDCDGCGSKFSSNDSLKKHRRLVCGKAKPLKPYHELSKWGKGHRAKATARDLISKLEGMGEEERSKTLKVVAKDKPHLLDHLTTNPFTIADILSVSFLSFQIFFN